MQQEKHKLQLRSVRLEALGDGVFAVAMTLLAVELKWPHLEDTSLRAFSNAFQEILPGLLCYIISFIILGIMWFGHRMVFEYIGKSNRYFIFLGVLFYMMVCLVPLSTRFLAENNLQWATILVYGLNLSFCNLSLYAQWCYGIKRENFLEKELPESIKKEAKILFLISPVVYAIAIIISVWQPLISIIIFIITPLIYLIPNKLDKYLP
ncbi:MAG: TMEM175 family protein [Parafilimonas sp.]